jgi:hypothetical protein
MKIKNSEQFNRNIYGNEAKMTEKHIKIEKMFYKHHKQLQTNNFQTKTKRLDSEIKTIAIIFEKSIKFQSIQTKNKKQINRHYFTFCF